jgi:hypothetical protein
MRWPSWVTWGNHIVEEEEEEEDLFVFNDTIEGPRVTWGNNIEGVL